MRPSSALDTGEYVVSLSNGIALFAVLPKFENETTQQFDMMRNTHTKAVNQEQASAMLYVKSMRCIIMICFKE